MNTKKMILSVIMFCTVIMVSANGNNTCTQMPRTQEMFQKDLERFVEETQKDMLAQKIIPVDSTHLLNEAQKKSLQEAKVLAKKRHYKIKLPIELNNIIGDSSNNKRYESLINLEDAYFIKVGDSIANLVIPMQAKVDTLTINSSLNITMNLDKDKYSVVRTFFTLQGEGNTKYMCMQSSVNGFLSSTLFLEGDSIIDEVKGKDYDKAGLYSEKIIHQNKSMNLYITATPKPTIEELNKSISKQVTINPKILLSKNRY